MGDFYPDPTRPGRWIHDPNAPTPGQNPPPTHILNAVPSADAPREFTQDDGSTYTRLSAAEFESFDDIDSTTKADPGAPA